MAANHRPLIDRQRSSSRETHTRSHPASQPPSPFGSPVGSPPLRSALKQHTGNAESDTGFSLHHPAAREAGKLTEGGVLSLPPASTNSGGLGSMYSRRVGFDTFDSGVTLESTGSNTGGGTGVNYSFTLSAKSAHFCRTKASRTFLVGTDLNEYSAHALDWLLSSLVENNDEVVVLRVIEPGSTAWNTWRSGEEGMDKAREKAEGVLNDVMKKNGETRQISIIVEWAIGSVEETIHRMIEIYRPDSLIVGTRGRPDSVWKSAFMGSISKYCVAKSPVPVVVVRPEDKVKESLSRRLQEGKKRSYLSLLSQEDKNTSTATLERTITAPAAGEGKEGRGRSSAEMERKEVAKEGKEMKRFQTFS